MSGPADLPAARRFAEEWVAAWNAHDLDRILSHYVETVEFRSRKAARLVGDGVIRGKSALRTYWAKALEMQPDLQFHFDRVYLGHGVLIIAYRNHRGVEATEAFEFGPTGDVLRSAACHGE